MTETSDKPLFNIRWGYAIAFFIAPPTLVGFDEGGPDLAVVGLVLGLAFVAYIAVLDWSIETDHWIGDYTFVGTLSGLALSVAFVVGLVLVDAFGLGALVVALVVLWALSTLCFGRWLS